MTKLIEQSQKNLQAKNKNLAQHLSSWDSSLDSKTPSANYDKYDNAQLDITLKLRTITDPITIAKLKLERQILRYKRDYLNIILINSSQIEFTDSEKDQLHKYFWGEPKTTSDVKPVFREDIRNT